MGYFDGLASIFSTPSAGGGTYPDIVYGAGNKPTVSLVGKPNPGPANTAVSGDISGLLNSLGIAGLGVAAAANGVRQANTSQAQTTASTSSSIPWLPLLAIGGIVLLILMARRGGSSSRRR